MPVSLLNRVQSHCHPKRHSPLPTMHIEACAPSEEPREIGVTFYWDLPHRGLGTQRAGPRGRGGGASEDKGSGLEPFSCHLSAYLHIFPHFQLQLFHFERHMLVGSPRQSRKPIDLEKESRRGSGLW